MKKPRGRPLKYPLPEPIPDTPEEHSEGRAGDSRRGS